MNLIHYAIVGDDFSVKSKWMHQLLEGNAPSELKELQGKKGLLFSEVLLYEFIAEDYKHGKSELIPNDDRSLRTFSSGEKKKVFLNYLLDQKPDFLVLDNPFDSLDKTSVEELISRLKQISENTGIIQIFNRKEDLLPFIGSVLKLEEGRFKEYNATSFLESKKAADCLEIKAIPPAPEIFQKTPEILVEMKNVSVSYGKNQILNNINWKIKKGDYWQLIGPNGSGKTTLLSMIYGDNPKAFGLELYLFGNKKGSGESVWEIKSKIGYFSPSLIELFTTRNTVMEMLISGLKDSVGLYQIPSDKEARLAKKWLDTLNLGYKSEAIFIELSELHKRIILIARAMIKHPPLLILDEPTTALDDQSAFKMTSLINYIANYSETVVIFVSHRIEKGLQPKAVFRLIPSENGSYGEIISE
jgi:molybdate transport system ATP-binding protein